MKIVDALKHVSLWAFAHHMNADAVVTAMAYHQCSEVDSKRKFLKNCSTSEYVPADDVYGPAKV